MRSILIVGVLSLISSLITLGQSAVGDKWNAQSVLVDQSPLYNGPEYTEHHPYAEGHPFLDTEEWSTGNVTYGGQIYTNVNLRMDITSDALVLENHTVIPYFSGIRLLSSRVSQFNIGNRHFININDAPELSAGYYEVIEEGTMTLLAKRVKELNEKIIDGKVEGTFLIKDRFYIKDESRFHRIVKIKQLYKLFPEEKKRIREKLSTIGNNDLENSLREAIVVLNQRTLR
jgi:hypothetical protein